MESTVKTIQIHIEGISCINCCNKIEGTLSKTKGILSVRVSYETQIADITYNSDIITQNDIFFKITEIGYDIADKKSKKLSNSERITIILAIIICLYFVLQKFGILNLLAPSDLAETNMGYGMLFIIGLATSVHCVAMCGGINLSQSISKGNEHTGKISTFIPTLLYNLGRIISYTLIGCIMGFIGFMFGGNSDAAVPTLLQGILKLAAGIFMVIMGLNMLGILPKLRRFMPKMPKSVSKNVITVKKKHKQPFIVGLLNGFMPCGPLYSMHIVALASANPIVGGLSMLMFSLGTVPLMLGFGSIVSALGRKFSNAVTLVGSILVTVMGLAMLSQGGSLSGMISSDMIMILVVAFSAIAVVLSVNFKKKAYKNIAIAITAAVIVFGTVLFRLGNFSLSSDDNVSEGDAEMVDGIQVVNSTLSSGTYPDITVKSGIPVKWIIYAPDGTVNGCNYSIIINEFNIKYDFHTGENIIEFTPEKTGKYEYSCWMGMIKANITVI